MKTDDLVGMLLDDREQVGKQLALEIGEIGWRLGRQVVLVVRAVDRLVGRDRDVARRHERRCSGPHFTAAARFRRGAALGGLVGRISHANAPGERSSAARARRTQAAAAIAGLGASAAAG